MDIEAFRQEIASYLPTDAWQVYAYVTGAPSLDALLVEMPDRIEPGASFTHSKIEFSILVIVKWTDPKVAQEKLMAALKTGDSRSVLDALNAHRHGTTYRGLNFTSASDFGTIVVGQATGLACTLNFSALITS